MKILNQMLNKLTPKHFALAAALLLAFSLLMFARALGQPPLHKGWYNVKWLKKHGYSVPASVTKKSIYLRPVADSTKANIRPVIK